MPRKIIYLDYAATTPLAREAEKKMIPFNRRFFGNPRSSHAFGQEARKKVEQARLEVARLLGAPEDAIIFNSGGTEGNNQAVLGIVRACKKKMKNAPNIIVTSLEHASVLSPAEALKKEGAKLTVLPVNEQGNISIAEFAKALNTQTALVAFSLVQNEIGVISPVQKIRKEINKYKKSLGRSENDWPYLHIDATQAPRVLSLKFLYGAADSFTLDGSKIYGPKGTGVWARRPTLPVEPLLYGAGQEGGLRSGTPNVSGVIGFAAALSLACLEAQKGWAKLADLKNKFLSELKKRGVGFVVNGNLAEGSPSILNISIPGISAEMLLMALSRRGIFISTTSACSSSDKTASRVILALGKGEEFARSSVRLSFGRETTLKEVFYSAGVLAEIVSKLKKKNN